ncbi:MAG: hypothetical protein LBC87_11600 [Fibromonadaceae bacterium]|jgi:hypothetical protein|nr:hypothetical protein [Fibromonadaceae bacterium]
MIDEITIDKPATLRDIEQLMLTMSGDSSYVKPEEYRQLIGMSRTQFMNLKKLGRFDKGTHKATLGGRYVLIHKNFDMHTQRIELSGNEEAISNKRAKNVVKPKKPKQQETLPMTET